MAREKAYACAERLMMLEEGYIPKGWVHGEPIEFIKRPSDGDCVYEVFRSTGPYVPGSGTYCVSFLDSDKDDAEKWLKWWFKDRVNGERQSIYAGIEHVLRGD